MAVPEDEKSEISITGNNNLQTGNNAIFVIVTAENGEQKTYTINVTKSNMANLSNSKLENLEIENATLIPEFNPNEFNYTAQISSDISSVNILAVPKIETATVEITGDQNLQYGENEVAIIVTSENGQSADKYIIKVYKKTEEEQTKVNNSENVPDLYGESEKLKVEEDTKRYGSIFFAIIVSISLIIAVAIMARGYLAKKKTNRSN